MAHKKSSQKLPELTRVSRQLQLFSKKRPRATNAKAAKAAAKALGVAGAERNKFYDELRQIAEDYFGHLHRRAVPTDAEQGAYLRNILGHLRRVKETIDQLPRSGVFHLQYPFWVFKYEPLLGEQNLSTLPEYLNAFIPACERQIKKLHGRAGARNKDHIAQTASALVQVWTRYTRRHFPRSFDTDLDRKKIVFTSEAAQFVLLAIHAFDPDVGLAEVGVALRTALGRVRKSPPAQAE